ncbi:hypothetical protein HDZ31DRAFT_64672 [Schizophyllum fasciatum]
MSFGGLFSSTRSTASSSRGKVTFMSINVVPGQPESSFEELRVQDYLKAYTTTGKPPPPVPAQPADAAGRSAMGLPPLFEGVLIDESSGAPEAPAATHVAYTDPAKLPPAQEFSPYEDPQERVKYQSICCHPSYQAFSPEELRYWAYLGGHKEPPTPVKMSPFTIVPQASSSTSRPSLTGYATANSSSSGDQMQSINASSDFNGHCFEELRYEFLKHGRELTSKEIFASYGAAPPVAAAPGLAPSGAATGLALPGTTPGITLPGTAPPAIPGLAASSSFGGAPATPAPATAGMFTFSGAGAGPSPASFAAGPPATPFAATPTQPATPFSATPTQPATPFAATPAQPTPPFGAAQPGSAAPRRFW